MRLENVIKALKDRRLAMQESVFKREKFEAIEFAKEQGRWLGIGEAINTIAEEMRKEQDD